NCGALVMPHRACPACGQYKGRSVINVEESK
ncbi:MAG: 50S ribosomal protein L32, partial [Oscillospiraceae bacterium]|nr:50S ribosomal protein L32 [Oscillospiraceae bacterium]